MNSPSDTASHALELSDSGRLKIAGAWTLPNFDRLNDVSAHFSDAAQVSTLDFSSMDELDTAGAQLLAELIGPARLVELAATAAGLSASRAALLELVGHAASDAGKQAAAIRARGPGAFFEKIGNSVASFAASAIALIGFAGLVLEAFGRTILRPKRWRVTATVAQLEQTAYDALPIVALLTFMVGAVIAFLGATVLADFGASVYTIDLIGFSFLREFGILLAAILMAGRTASAFTAQLGSMKANEEIDAIRALGLNPIELLVLPRVLAMVMALPMLTFVAMIAGLVGGAMVCVFSLDISLTLFIDRLHEDIAVRHFLVGMAKAPVFAFVIACIGCLEGMRVSGSAQSVGEHTTSSVVQSIFVVILLDALTALFAMEMGW